MAYPRPAGRYRLWKEDLRQGQADPAVAAAVGRQLGRIHAGTADDPVVAARFDSEAIFRPIRLEPYLLATAEKHPDRGARWNGWSRRRLPTRRALVHGDVSPKNILIGPKGPVFLDAECAWFGDPAFDLAFCANHMLLKCLWVPVRRRLVPGLLRCARRRLSGLVDWEPAAELEARAAHLLPGLFLGPGRRQVAGGISRRRDGQGPGAPGRPCAAGAPVDRLAAVRDPPGPTSSACREFDGAVRGRRVWDSRGRPTVEVELALAGGATGRAIAPAGASTGSGEAIDLRDGGDAFGGQDVTRAVAAVNGPIAAALAGADAADQAGIDRLLIEADGTDTRRAWAAMPWLQPRWRRPGRRGRRRHAAVASPDR